MFHYTKKQSGFTLLEVLLAVTIAIALGSLQLSRIKHETENMQAKAVGEQLKMVGNALNSYIALEYTQIINGTDVAAPGTAADPGPRTCTNTGSGIRCIITSDTLQRLGLVPNSFSGRNAYGASYKYWIRVQGAAPNWRVDGLVFTDTPYTMGGSPRFDLIGQAMLVAGADSGTTRTSPSRVDGFDGTWAETGYPTTGSNAVANQVGLLAYRAGYGTSGYSSFLRLDGTTPMTGDLQMTGGSGIPHNITGANNITGQGTFTAAQFKTKNAASDAIILDASHPNNRTLIGNNGNALLIRNEGGLQLANTSGNATDITAGDATFKKVNGTDGVFSGDVNAKSLTSTTYVHANGIITSDSNISASGNFSTVNGNFTTTNGNISALNGTVQSKNLVVTNNATINRAIYLKDGSATSGWMYDGGSNVMTLLNNADLSINGDITSTKDIKALGKVISNNPLQINAVQSVGSSCGATNGPGSFARDSQGRMLECIGGIWKLSGGVKATTVRYGSLVNSGGTSTATCPSGYKLTGGGYAQQQKQLGSAPQSSYPDIPNNRWVVNASDMSNLTQAVAVCAK